MFIFITFLTNKIQQQTLNLDKYMKLMLNEVINITVNQTTNNNCFSVT